LAAQAHPCRGYLYIAGATFLWGIAAGLGRAVFTGRLLPAGGFRSIDPLILAQSRTTISFLVLLPILLAARGPAGLHVRRADLGRMVVLGVLGIAASNYLAIQRANVATAITVQYTAPVWVLLYMVVRGLQKASLRRVGAVVLAVTGIALVIGIIGSRPFQLDPMGVVAALLAAFSFAFYNIGGHKILARYDHWNVLLFTTLSAGLFWQFVNPPWKIAAAHYSPAQWGFLAVFALVSVLGPFSLYFAGLKYLEPTKAIVTSCLEPVFSILIAAVALGETVRPLQALGVGVVLAGIVMVQLPDRDGAGPQVEPIE
jgi:drug/metabolite transporter (DMT)-like permease